MDTLKAWYAPRHRVSMWILAGWTSFVVVFALGWWAWPRPAPVPAPVDRALLALELAAGPALVLYLVLQGLWRVMDTPEAEDPFKNAESHAFRVNQRVMTNTVEQTSIFAPMLVALAIRMEPDQVFALQLLTATWCAGRILFWIGYRIDPVWRAIGMDWTSGCAMVTAGWLGWTLVT